MRRASTSRPSLRSVPATRPRTERSRSRYVLPIRVPIRRKPEPIRLGSSRAGDSDIALGATSEAAAAGSTEEQYAIVVAKFNSLVTKSLLEGAQEAFADSGRSPAEVYWVPGSFETPLVAKKLAKTGRYAAVVCLGAIIRGGTSHYDAVVSAATNGVLRAGMDSETPVIFGVLTCDTMEQALDRAGGKMGNKGYEAAQTALEMSRLMDRIAHVEP